MTYCARDNALNEKLKHTLYFDGKDPNLLQVCSKTAKNMTRRRHYISIQFNFIKMTIEKRVLTSYKHNSDITSGNQPAPKLYEAFFMFMYKNPSFTSDHKIHQRNTQTKNY